jgi:hypothetical protein
MAIVASLALALTAACTAPSESAADEEDPPLPATVVEAADRDIKGRIADAVDLDGVDLWVGSPAAEAGDATSAILAALTIRSL